MWFFKIISKKLTSSCDPLVYNRLTSPARAGSWRGRGGGGSSTCRRTHGTHTHPSPPTVVSYYFSDNFNQSFRSMHEEKSLRLVISSGIRRHMWVESVIGFRPCSEGFCPASPVLISLLHKKKKKKNQTNKTSKFQFDRESEVYRFICQAPDCYVPPS